MGIFIETKHLKDLSGTLVISGNLCTVQQISEDTITLIEWIVPILHNDRTLKEVAVELDFKTPGSIVHITDEWVHSGNKSTRYKKGDIVSWGTRLPELIAIVCASDTDLEGDECIISVDGSDLSVGVGDEVVHHKTLHTFRDFVGITVDLRVLKGILESHTDQVCKLYAEEDFPLCLEFISDDGLTKRYYVAPICID